MRVLFSLIFILYFEVGCAQFFMRTLLPDSSSDSFGSQIELVDTSFSPVKVVANLGFLNGTLGPSPSVLLCCGDHLYCMNLHPNGYHRKWGHSNVLVFIAYEVRSSGLVPIDSVVKVLNPSFEGLGVIDLQIKERKLVLSTWQKGGSYWVDFSLDLEQYMKGDILDFLREFEAFTWRKVPKNLARSHVVCDGKI